jgi:hypothetical protein
MTKKHFVMLGMMVLASFIAYSRNYSAAAEINGILESPQPGTSIFGPVTINGPWLEFSFLSAGSLATGCAPADPNGLPCGVVPTSAFADAPPWTNRNSS